MSTLYHITADTKRRSFHYGPFIIEENILGWECTHDDYGMNAVRELCQTVFEAIEAADAWLEAQENAA